MVRGKSPLLRSKRRHYAAPQDEFKNRRKTRSRRGNEADRRRAEAALWRVAKAEVFFAPKSASLPRRLPFLNIGCAALSASENHLASTRRLFERVRLSRRQ